MSDPLHPTGRCTCAGEGLCGWCRSHCNDCGAMDHSTERHGAAMDEIVPKLMRELDDLRAELAQMKRLEGEAWGIRYCCDGSAGLTSPAIYIAPPVIVL